MAEEREGTTLGIVDGNFGILEGINPIIYLMLFLSVNIGIIRYGSTIIKYIKKIMAGEPEIELNAQEVELNEIV